MAAPGSRRAGRAGVRRKAGVAGLHGQGGREICQKPLMRMPRWLPLMLGFLAAVGPISTDMYLPAFPAIEATYGGAAGSAQLTLATWFAGIAVGQISQGVLSDRFGRRRPLLVSTLVYTAASLGCVLAPSLGMLAAYRFIQGLGGSAGMVVSRAVIRDLSDGLEAARMMSRLMLVMGVAPLVAPTLGGLLLTIADWHVIFWVCTAYGAIGAVSVWFLLPETLPPEARVKLRVGQQAARFGAILGERSFLTHAGIGSAALFTMFAYLAGSPQVFIGIYHLPPPVFGMIFGACAAGYVAGAQANPLVLMRFGMRRVLHVATLVSLAVPLVLLGLAWMQPGAWYAIAIPLFLTMLTLGFVTPNATVGALSRHAAHAGSASALMGTMQYVTGAISGLAVGLWADGTARPMAALMVAGGITAVLCALARPRS